MRYAIKARDTYAPVFHRVAASEHERKKAEYFGKEDLLEDEGKEKEMAVVPALTGSSNETSSALLPFTQASTQNNQSLLPKKASAIPK